MIVIYGDRIMNNNYFALYILGTFQVLYNEVTLFL